MMQKQRNGLFADKPHIGAWGSLVVFLVVTLAACAPGNRRTGSETDMDRLVMEQKVANARTRSDHEALAAMYQQHAEADKSASERHKSMAAGYRSAERAAGPSPMAAHCDRLVELYRQAAAENQALAALHRAKAAETE